jgi:hypothetical protein
MEKIDIIIPTKNHVDDLLKCLAALNKSFSQEEFQVDVIIIDDGSKKQEREKLIKNTKDYVLFKNFCHINIVMTNKNIGFAKAINAGINIIKSKRERNKTGYIGILHDDTIVHENWIKSLISEFDHDVAAVGSKSSNPNDTLKPGCIGLFAAIFKSEYIQELETNLISSIDIEETLTSKYIKKLKLVETSIIKHQARCFYKNNEIKIVNQQIENFKNIFDPNIKNVVYTFVGPDEELPTISNNDLNCEYVCFSNNQKLLNTTNDIWKIIDVSDFYKILEVSKFDKLIKEYFKIHPHVLFKNKQVSIWIDSSKISEIKKIDYSKLISLLKENQYLVSTNSNYFDCVYDFIFFKKREKLITDQEFNYALELFKWHHFPRKNNLIDTSILIRSHCDERCVHVMNRTWNYIKKCPGASDIFLNLVIWLNKNNYSYIPKNILINEFVSMEGI